jgi:ACS family hexuronate transporter-like MFS transporter
LISTVSNTSAIISTSVTLFILHVCFGIGEAEISAAIKTTAEYFPKKDRAFLQVFGMQEQRWEL